MSEDLWGKNQPDDILNTPTAKHRRNGDAARLIGCPLWWFTWVFPIVHGKNELAIALYVYRLRIIQHSRTVKVSNERLASELGIDRFAKYRALKRLADAGVITVKRPTARSLEITLRQCPKRAQRSSRKM
jgi:hypothetical protein